MKNKVYQIKVSLQHISPPIWRRIEVPADGTFWDLHVAIQDALGWMDYHLHNFVFKNPLSTSPRDQTYVGIPTPEDDGRVMPGWSVKMADFLNEDNKRCRYDYDFGDGWMHDVVLEKILDKEEGVKYPRCTKGKRACPPEDCGGPWGYEELLKLSKKKGKLDEEDKERLEWLGDFDPEYFEIDDITFDDPRERLVNFKRDVLPTFG